MDKAPSDEQDALRLANSIRDLLGRHLASDDKSYVQLITSTLIALSMEVGRLRWLATSTNEVDPENFDHVFWEAAMKQFNENQKLYGTLN